MSKKSYVAIVWKSKNGRWWIVDLVSENEKYSNINGETRFFTTMYIEEQGGNGYQDYPTMYDDRRVAYDHPERIPAYVKKMYAKKMGARRQAQEKLVKENEVVGYYNWCDTYCSECVASKHIDVSSYTTLTHKQAVEDIGYTCDMCGMAFPKDVVLKLLQVN